MAWKPTIAVDFDGCLHSYTSGWKGPLTIADPPTEGALVWLKETAEHFTVAIFSARNKETGAIKAMRDWLANQFALAKIMKKTEANAFVKTLQFPVSKPPANMYIDDRGFQFTGRWPTYEEMRSFKPERGVKGERRQSADALAFEGVARTVMTIANELHNETKGCEMEGATGTKITCPACRIQSALREVVRHGR